MEEDSPSSILIEPSFSSITHYSEYGIHTRLEKEEPHRHSHQSRYLVFSSHVVSLSCNFLDDTISQTNSIREIVRRNSVWLSGVGFLRSRRDQSTSVQSQERCM